MSLAETVTANLDAWEDHLLHECADEYDEPLLERVLQSTLQTHQKSFVTWAKRREVVVRSSALGGFVMDEPGLGKTLQILCLVARRPTSLGPTLIICPTHLMAHWETESQIHFREGTFRVHKYFGPSRFATPIPEDTNLILTSYGMLKSDMYTSLRMVIKKRLTRQNQPDEFPGFRKDSIFTKTWYRLVVDESHNIRNDNQLSAAAMLLQSNICWCISATPIMNKVNDLFNQISLIGISPFDVRAEWNDRIASPMSYRPVTTFDILMRHVITPFSIRRTKRNVVDMVDRNEQVVWLDFTPDENLLYDTLLKMTRERVNRLLANIQLMENNRNIQSMGRFMTRMRMGVMVFLLRLRQCCCHPSIIARKIISMSGDDEIQTVLGTDRNHGPTESDLEHALRILTEKLESGLDEECSICFDATATHSNGNCSHRICVDCGTHMLKHNIMECPLCRTYAPNWFEGAEALVLIDSNLKRKRADDNNSSDLVDLNSREIDPLLSVKAKWVHDDMQTHEFKVVIVSQWVEHLNIYKQMFTNLGINWCMLSGQTSADKRFKTVIKFQTDPSIRVCLLSMTSSAEGITLTAACRLYHIDPWWNDSKTTQASDRVHRIGQTNNVKIVHLRIKNSIENAMHDMQLKKREIFDVICGTKQAGDHMTFANNVNLMLGDRERAAYTQVGSADGVESESDNDEELIPNSIYD